MAVRTIARLANVRSQLVCRTIAAMRTDAYDVWYKYIRLYMHACTCMYIHACNRAAWLVGPRTIGICMPWIQSGVARNLNMMDLKNILSKTPSWFEGRYRQSYFWFWIVILSKLLTSQCSGFWWIQAPLNLNTAPPELQDVHVSEGRSQIAKNTVNKCLDF